MNDIQVFNSPEFGEIRTVEIGGKPYFVGADVAKALGYKRGTKAVQDHVDEEDRDAVPIQDSIGRMQNTPIINESGLYSLILSSKLPSAKRFKHWVTSEVLPSIRKHGIYATEAVTDKILNFYGTFQNKHERYKTIQLRGITRNATVLCECSHLEKLQKVAKEVATFIATLH